MTTEGDLLRGDWSDPQAGRVQLQAYATAWVRERPGLRPKTLQLYEGLLRLHIVPGLGHVPVSELTPAHVRTWRAELLARGLGPVTVAKAYRLLRAVMGTAEDDRLIRRNPCQIKGASTERSPERPMLTLTEVYALADAVPERFRILVLLATFASLRWGELTALTRAAVDAETGTVKVEVAMVELRDGRMVVGPPKSDAGRRTVSVPAALLPELREHLRRFTSADPSSLVFTGLRGNALRRSNFQQHWVSARTAAGVRSGVHFHDLRHTGNTLTAHAGATLSDLMSRMGHSSTRAARIYLHTTFERDRAVAAALNELLVNHHRL
ncbi:MAG: tyrosine-type recombinase/integrase [Janthinobacterium lividum]